ncbi:alpha/beta hydrolase family esterase [Corynebacterium liangguodongii]|uniref:Uncharacterized protein n=1 Tax=Corynebacterium liangguodongii TaxID=2079535 RepID=A0A2S0WFV2_9CORY|nr:hypothetical protein [Corynebacterium liangguodongii]AWB84639.1 hypothetical protein C3E79_09280 [Corynebacterium liangguodongii]PWB99647.1 hypothetical protein DF219_05060 [Corynebacterium liangguodongii]
MPIRHIEHQGRVRRVIEVPGAGPTDTLVMFLHGSRQSGAVARNFTAHTFDALAAPGTTVIYPDGVGHHFNDLRTGFHESARTEGIDDVGFLRTLIESYQPRRVIGCGFSNGGQMLLRMLFDAPSTLDGVAMFGSLMPTDDNLAVSTANYAPTPLLIVHGTADPIVPYGGGEAGLGAANRGTVRSAAATARYFARLNGSTSHSLAHPAPGVEVETFGGDHPVELVSIEGMGHLVPSPKRLDPRIGPGTDAVVGAELMRDFFGL